MGELGLDGRLTKDLTDNSKEGSKLVAAKIVNHVGGWLTERLNTAQNNQRIENASNEDLNDSLRELFSKIVKHIGASPQEWQPLIETLLVRPFLEKQQ